MTTTLTAANLAAYAEHLKNEERSAGTIESYLRHLRAFARWLDGRTPNKDTASAWKTHLLASGYQATTINSKLAALNSFFAFSGCADCRVKPLRLQRRLFRDEQRQLTRQDYERLVATAQRRGQEQLALVMETICATGIRVSELAAITLQALAKGRADIALKGKVRTILLPRKLCRKLQTYARKQHLQHGALFRAKNGAPLSRHQIWRAMKTLAHHAGVAAGKVFPHNLRHLFAQVFYANCRDVVRLADMLGHSSVETTRLYLRTSVQEHTRWLETMRLVQ
ncbi:MAG: tyrosine-type recombinase/integrase [Peptococcaceae bacterium]|nr:tyrosine-type recombinase/integrase [Peptococcaceae bacterium]